MKERLRTLTGIGLCMGLAAGPVSARRAIDRTAAVGQAPGPQPAIVNYMVASPRATLATTPPLSAEVDDVAEVTPYRTLGAACNFARPSGQTVTVREGTTVFVGIKPEAEGVWYERASGWLGAIIIVEIAHPRQPDRWYTLGRDGAAALRIGPSIGVAGRKIGVKARITRPGRYLMRARLYTYALPVPLTDEAPTRDDLRPYGDVDMDTVNFMLRVVGINDPAPAPEAYEPVEKQPLDTEVLMGTFE